MTTYLDKGDARRENKTKASVRAGFWFVVCNIIQRGIQFLVTPIYTRLLLPEGYGKYSTFLTWCNLMAVITTLNLSCGVFNTAMAKFDKDRDNYLISMIGLALTTTFISSTIYFFIYKWISEIVGLSVTQSIMMYICVFFQMIVQLWSAKQKYEYGYRKLIFITLIYALLTPFIGILLFYNINIFHNEMGIIVGYTIANIIVGVFLVFESTNKLSSIFIKKYWKYALAFNIPLIPHYLSGIVLGQSDRLMISYYCGNYYTGIYTLAYQISLIMNIASSGIEGALVPWTYENLKQENYQSIRKRFGQLIIISVVPFILFLLAAPEIILILGSEEYRDALYIIPPVVISSYFTFINIFIGSILFYHRKNINVMLSSIAGAIINVILNMILIPQIGYVAAAYTTIVGFTVICCINFITMRRKLWKLGKEIYNLKIIVMGILIVIFAGIVAFKLYLETIIIRWLIIIVFCMVLLIKRKPLFLLIEKLPM